METQRFTGEIVMILLTTLVLLLLAFIVHLLWWRIRMPIHTTGMLLSIFFAVPAILGCVWHFSYGIAYSLDEIVRLLFLYVSSSLVYIILYSAIEQQSPSLAMVRFIYNAQKQSCDDTLLISSFNIKNEMSKRLFLMEQSGWLTFRCGRFYLTTNGSRIAKVFHYAARVFGLKSGG